MKAVAFENKAHAVGIKQTIDCHIKAGAKIFNILSTLYSNKIKAVIREVCCNAADSHKEAKQSRPFVVHLPNTLEPYFSVKDYGLGLDNDQIIKVYTTYGESTKDQNNLYTGGFGIGAKSPFCYTDNFTVTAIKNGIKNIYVAMKNDRGEPVFSKMYTTETHEENGVEVKFGVETKDFFPFIEETANVLQWFDVLPEITGVEKLEIPVREYSLRDLIPGVHLNSDWDYYTRQTAIMANVAYPLVLPTSVVIPKHLQHIVKDQRIEIHFETGEIDILPSREAISYDKRTINKIIDKYENINKAIREKVINELTPLDEYSKLLKARELLNGLTAPLIEELTEKEFFKLAPINKNLYSRHKLCNLIFKKTNNPEFTYAKINAIRGGHVLQVQESKSIDMEHIGVPILTKKPALFVHLDTNNIDKQKLRLYMLDNKVEEAYITRKPQTVLEDIMQSKIEMMPMSKIKELIKQKYPQTRTSNKRGQQLTDLLVYGGDAWVNTELKDLEGQDIIFLPISNKNPIINNKKLTKKEFEEVLNPLIRLFNIDKYQIVGVRKQAIAAAKAEKTWISIEEYVDSKLKTSRKNIERHLNLRSGSGELINYNHIKNIKTTNTHYTELMKLLQEETCLLEEYTPNYASSIKVNLYNKIANTFKKPLITPSSQELIRRMEEKLLQDYPLLGFLYCHIQEQTFKKAVQQYFNQGESQ